jgi:tetratricopeptide (TPR) repeat protein
MLGQYDEAEKKLETSLKMLRREHEKEENNRELGDHSDIASALNYLGILNVKRGNYNKAESLFNEALEMFGRVYGANAKNRDIALTLYFLGEMYFESGYYRRGNYERAKENYELVLAMSQNLVGNDASNPHNAMILRALEKVKRAQRSRLLQIRSAVTLAAVATMIIIATRSRNVGPTTDKTPPHTA